MGLRVAAAAVGAGACLSAAAGIAGPAAEDSAADPVGLEEVVVTAQRREESAQSVGIAMSVLSGDSLADKSISYVNDLQNAVPSLQVEPAFGSSQPQFRSRGVGFIDYTSNNTSPVGVSLDGVAFALPIQTQGQLFDIDRVEVLRGPQGTLYGRNTTGGEINFISNRPTADPHAGSRSNTARTMSSTPKDSSPAALPRACWDGSPSRRSRAAHGSAIGSPANVWATRTRSRFAASCNGIRRRRSIFGSACTGRRINPMRRGALIAPYQPYNAGPGGAGHPGGYLALCHRLGAGSGVRQADRHQVPDSKPGLDNATTASTSPPISISAAPSSRHHRLQQDDPARIRDWDATQFYDSDEYLSSYLDVFSQEAAHASTGAGRVRLGGRGLSIPIKISRRISIPTSRPTRLRDIGGIVLTNYGQIANSLGEFGQATISSAIR